METHYAKIKNRVVDQIEVVTDEFVAVNPERYKNHVKVKGSAGRGYTYKNKVFTSPQPFKSWVLKNNLWEAPKKKPEGDYYWDEETLNWKKNNIIVTEY